MMMAFYTIHESPKAALLGILGATALALALLLSLRPAAAATPSSCLARADMTQLLASRYAEAPVAAGLSSDGHLIQVYSTGDRATWTIVVTTPQGVSCVIANGEAWDMREKAALGQRV